MADHLHKQIRAAAVTKLTGLATTGAHVYANRLHPFDSTLLPGLRLSLGDDAVTPLTVHTPHVQGHALELIVEGVAAATSALDDTCDQIAKEVEVALAAGITVAGTTLFPILLGSSYDDEAAGTPAGSRRLTFGIEYRCLNTTPDTLA